MSFSNANFKIYGRDLLGIRTKPAQNLRIRSYRTINVASDVSKGGVQLVEDRRSSLSSVAIQDVAYRDATFSISGLLTTDAPPDLVYNVLTDYASLPRIFHNVDECTVSYSPDGNKNLVQRCSWKFLVFRGQFITELAVEEDANKRTLAFSLIESGTFMRTFIGSWDVRQSARGSEVRHSLSVSPVVAPPQSIGELTKNIFVSQVENILKDLSSELDRQVIDSLE